MEVVASAASFPYPLHWVELLTNCLDDRSMDWFAQKVFKKPDYPIRSAIWLKDFSCLFCRNAFPEVGGERLFKSNPMNVRAAG